MQSTSRLKRIALAEAFLFLALSVAMLGYVTLGAIGALESGRDPTPLFLLSGLVIVVTGFVANYLFELIFFENFMVLVPWLVLLYMLVSFGTGLIFPDLLFMSWFATAAATLVLPWSVGALLGRWARRK